MRLWLLSGNAPRGSTSVLNNGFYIPTNTAFPAAKIFLNGQSTSGTIYAEGVNPTDPASTQVEVDIDPLGTGDWVMHDFVRFTVASMQIVYTDVSGLSHNYGETLLPVPRIATNQQPEGLAADWKNGVDDGSMLLLRLVGSPAIADLADAQHSFNVSWGVTYQDIGLTNPNANDGELDGFQDGLVANPDLDLEQLGIENVGQTWGNSNMTVLAAEFYRPPTEFDLAAGTADTAQFRRIAVGATVSLNGQVAATGGKPEGLMLTRPPLVLVHGIDSGPGVWFDTSQGTSFFQAAKAAGYPGTFEVDHSGPDPVTGGDATHGEGEISDMYVDVANTIADATAAYREGGFFPPDPYATADPSSQNPADARIAVQKVDVVAHSYGGLLTRWYIEQSGEFASRRDIRSLLMLGTPNLGSPLANMVDAIITNPLIANAKENILHLVSLQDVLLFLDSRGKAGAGGLPAFLTPGTPYPFFEDVSVDSPRLQQLNTDPFSDDVGYAEVAGTDPYFKIPGSNINSPVNLYSYVEPTSTTGENYFPWMYLFDGQSSDSIVPTWSASLG